MATNPMTAHTAYPPAPRPAARHRLIAGLWPLLGLAAGASLPAHAQDAATVDATLLNERISALAREGASATAGQARVAVEVGTLDPRLTLAPCRRIEPYLPAGLPAWGRTRIGLRCVEGPKAWNVSLPVTVHIWARALVSTAALPVGTLLDPSHLSEAEVDLAAAPGTALTQLPLALGRTLARPVPAGQALRQPDLKPRVWFAAGETVKLVASGPGWRVVSEGQAITPGLEGLPAKVRTEAGHVLQGRPVGDREVEIAL